MMSAPRTVSFAGGTSRLRLIDVRYPAATDFDTHQHLEEYACLVVEGAYREWAPGGRDVRPGTEQMWAAGSRHAVRTGREEVRIVHVADPDATGRLADHPLRPGVLLQVGHALREADPADAADRLHLECLVAELEEDGGTGAPEAWLPRVRDRLRDARRESVDLSELSALAGRHPAHVTRAFRVRWGMTPGEYLRRIRVSEAVRLLRDTHVPLTGVAAAAGFADQSHMGRWMRRYAGVTPADVRAGGGGVKRPRRPAPKR